MTAAFSVAYCYTIPLNSSFPHHVSKTDGADQCSAAVVAPPTWSNGCILLAVAVSDHPTVLDQHDHVED